jgi:hypothetical protein
MFSGHRLWQDLQGIKQCSVAIINRRAIQGVGFSSSKVEDQGRGWGTATLPTQGGYARDHLASLSQ